MAILARLLPYKPLLSSPYMRIQLEVPIEQAQAVTAALGWPSPNNEIWVALARIKDELPQCDICGDHHEAGNVPRSCETGDGE